MPGTVLLVVCKIVSVLWRECVCRSATSYLIFRPRHPRKPLQTLKNYPEAPQARRVRYGRPLLIRVPNLLPEMAAIPAASDSISAKRGAFHEIPVIDFADAFSKDIERRKALARKIYEACVRVGFFYIRNHRVDDSIMKGVFSAARDFFNLPLEEKMEIDLNKSSHFRGYTKLMVRPRPMM